MLVRAKLPRVIWSNIFQICYSGIVYLFFIRVSIFF